MSTGNCSQISSPVLGLVPGTAENRYYFSVFLVFFFNCFEQGSEAQGVVGIVYDCNYLAVLACEHLHPPVCPGLEKSCFYTFLWNSVDSGGRNCCHGVFHIEESRHSDFELSIDVLSFYFENVASALSFNVIAVVIRFRILDAECGYIMGGTGSFNGIFRLVAVQVYNGVVSHCKHFHLGIEVVFKVFVFHAADVVLGDIQENSYIEPHVVHTVIL